MYIIFLLLSLLLLYKKINCKKFNLDIINTHIIEQIPIIKLHHIVILSQSDEFYTLDFTPIGNLSIKRSFNLLSGKNVPGEIRLRKITNLNNNAMNKQKKCKKYKFFLENYIINEFKTLNPEDYIESNRLSNITFNNIKNNDIKEFIKSYMVINKSMNLYTNNCQHFSKIVYNNYKKNYNKSTIFQY